MSAVERKSLLFRAVWVLASAIALAVLRRGLEVVLFLYGVTAGGANPFKCYLAVPQGCWSGITGTVMYFGLLGVPIDIFFTVTSAMILLHRSRLARSPPAFSCSRPHPAACRTYVDQLFSLGDSSILGKTLQALIGYTARPAGIQVVVYVFTLLIME